MCVRMMANGKKAFAKGRQFLAATGIISSDDSVEVDENVPGGNVDDDASTEFFRSMPGYKPNVQKKKTVPLAKPDFVEQQISSILARNPGICFDRAIIKDRDQARDAIAGRKRKELERHQNTMVALNTEGAFNDGLLEDDNNMKALCFGASLSYDLMNKKTLKDERKEKRAASRHARNHALVGVEDGREEPQKPRFSRALTDSFKPRERANKRIRRNHDMVDDEAEEVEVDENEDVSEPESMSA